MNILLFGGAFNPPHLGHLLVIEQAFELIPDLDELWLLPCYQHTFQKDLAPAKDRLAMCELLIQPSNHLAVEPSKLKVCDIEIVNQTSGSTYQTLQLLKTSTGCQVPSTKFLFLMGSDQLGSFEKWQHWQELLNEMPFYVYPRAGYPMEPLYPHMTTLESPTQVITNLSSTLIRNRLTQHLPLTHLIPPSIHNYILKNHLW